MNGIVIKKLPDGLTSYDLLKALAVILMVTDHVGHYFYPDEMWFRVVGRLCVPIWFFLIGYAKTTEIPKRLWVGAVIIAVSGLISGQFLLPLNILFTIIIMRYMRHNVVIRSFYSADGLRGMFLVLLFVTFPSAVVFDYGAIAMMFVLIGYIVRNREDVYKKIEPQYLKIFTAASFFTFFIMQGVGLPEVSVPQALFMMIGFAIVGLIVWNFKPEIYIYAPKHMAPSIIRLIQFMGRRTLEIYVIHILIFCGVAMYLYPETYSFLGWDYISSSAAFMFIKA